MCCMMGHEMSHEHDTATRRDAGEPPETLLDVLQRRYALGEISRDQLEEMKRVLGLGAGSAAGAPVGASAWESGHHG
jgi:uncharacterized membrane protein